MINPPPVPPESERKVVRRLHSQFSSVTLSRREGSRRFKERDLCTGFLSEPASSPQKTLRAGTLFQNLNSRLFMDITPGIQPPLPDNKSRQSAIQDTDLSPEIKNLLLAIDQEEVNPYLFELLYDCPGQGRHQWLFDVAYQLVLYFRNDADVEDILYTFVDASLPQDRVDREIPEAVKNARRYRTLSPEERLTNSSPTPKAKVRFSYVDKRVRAEAKGQFALLPKWSPVKGIGLEAEPVLDTIYSGNPLLCGGNSFGTAITRPREYFRGNEAQTQFLVPNPMTAEIGITKNGIPGSSRCLSNTGARFCLVIDLDLKPDKEPWGPYIARWAKKGISTWDAQTLIIRMLSLEGFPTLPLMMVVFSGNISLQAWYFVAHLHEDQITPFFERAVSLGADPVTWQRHQLIRMPGGTRRERDKNTGQIVKSPQPVLYLNPATIGGKK